MWIIIVLRVVVKMNDYVENVEVLQDVYEITASQLVRVLNTL